MSGEPSGEGVLAGRRILVTRPAHQADNLCRLIEAEGGTAVRLPLLTIEPVASPAEAQRRLAAGHDLWIFTSVNAVRHALPLAGGRLAASLAAIGPATAAALAAAGGAVAATPLAGASSEALLEQPELRDVAGKRILVVTGAEGLELLERTLRERGATVERAEVYRRVALPYPPETVLAALRRADVLVVTSGQALEHLVRLTPEEARKSLWRKALVVPSARMVEKARDLGFLQPPRVAEPVSDAALCAACAAVPPS
jgi:uroporphyrinogen-III synthase